MKRRGNSNWGKPESGPVVPVITKELPHAFFNPRASSLFSEPGDPMGSPLGRP
jgi:hypothetical protein